MLPTEPYKTFLRTLLSRFILFTLHPLHASFSLRFILLIALDDVNVVMSWFAAGCLP
jgi:hypothetical protein